MTGWSRSCASAWWPTPMWANGWQRFHRSVLDALAGVDLILHAGDITELSVLDRLGQIAKVIAVQGDHDRAAGIVLPAVAGRRRGRSAHRADTRASGTVDRAGRRRSVARDGVAPCSWASTVRFGAGSGRSTPSCSGTCTCPATARSTGCCSSALAPSTTPSAPRVSQRAASRHGATCGSVSRCRPASGLLPLASSTSDRPGSRPGIVSVAVDG